MAHPGFQLLFLSLLHFLLTSALELNITIDDQFGDQVTQEKPVFSPASAWATQTCVGCAIKPDVTKMYDQTYTAAIFEPDKGMVFNAIDFRFNGTAIYVFFTLFNFEGEGVTVNTECNFTIDGLHVGNFNHQGDGNQLFTRSYQAPVFSKTGLDQTMHHMNINTSGINYHVYTNFDFAIYTQETGATTTPSEQPTSPPKGHSNHSAAVVGGVLGGLGFLLGLLVAFWCYRRFQQKHHIPTLKLLFTPILDTSPDAANLPSQSLNSSQPLLRESSPSSPQHLPPSKRRPLARHAPNTLSQRRSTKMAPISTRNLATSPTSQPSNDMGSEGYTVPHEIAEEIWRLRAELAHLEHGVNHGQVHVPGGGEAPPAY